MAIICTFGNQKGGVGKSTLINQLANYIHYKTDYTVAVIDGDYIQESLTAFREHDININIANYELMLKGEGKIVTEELKQEWFDNYLKETYPLETVPETSIIQRIKELTEFFNFILVDMPGSLNSQFGVGVYMCFDYVFVPTDITFKDLDSTKRFLDIYDSKIRKGRSELNLTSYVYGVFNKLKEGLAEFKTREEKVISMGITIPFLKSYILENNKLRRDDNSLEVLRLEGTKNPDMIENFCKEVMNIMLNNKN